MEREVVLENKFGQISDYMKDSGRMINKMAKEDLFIQMAMFMKVYGRKERFMAEEK